MPVNKLLLQPGVNLQATPTLNQTQWAQTQFVRYYLGLLQKLGGWQKFSPFPVIGTCRSLLAWADLDGNPYVAAGTEQRLQVYIGSTSVGAPIDVTPLVGTTNNTPSFSTTAEWVTSATIAPAVNGLSNLTVNTSASGSGVIGMVLTGPFNATITIVSQTSGTTGGTGVYVVTNPNNVTNIGSSFQSWNYPLVTITDAAPDSPSVGDWINLITQVAVGGAILQGFYQIQSVGSGNYTVLYALTQATILSAVTNGGATPTFATLTIGQPTVQVVMAAHGFTAMESSFTVPLAVTVGGITLPAGTNYLVQTVVNSSTFTIDAATNATSVAGPVSLNSGNARIEYLLPTGNASSEALQGYGIGNYGAGFYGLANASSGVSQARIWAMDHWGEDLVASPTGGGIYYWDPASGAVPAAVVSMTAPLYNNWILVVPEVQILVALGAESDGTQYPLLVRWCDAADFTDWTPSVSNQAGSLQLNSGSALIAGAAAGLSVYLWTDFGVWIMTYQGLPFVFSFNEMGRECGAISSRSIAIASVGATWLSQQGFFTLTGSGIQPLECPVWDFYFANVDLTQLAAVTAGLDTAWHEVWWFFPVAAARQSVVGGAVAYVKWNWLESQGGSAVWDYGVLTRTAWIDASVAGNCLAVDANGLIQQHEVGNDMDGQPMQPYAQTHYFDIAQGDDYQFVDMLIPDVLTPTGTNMSMWVFAQDYPDGPTTTDGPYTVLAGQNVQFSTLPSTFATTNSRGRQVAFGFGTMDAGSSWRLGAVRYNFKPDGKI
jgi:hypothetical protein